MSRTAPSAALVLAAALLAAARPAAEPPPRACPRPAEAAAREGHTAAVRCGGGPALRGPARLLFALPIDPNRADARTLEALPGVGPVRAARIVAERARRPFAELRDLRRVHGIGPHTVAGLEGLAAVTAEARTP